MSLMKVIKDIIQLFYGMKKKFFYKFSATFFCVQKYNQIFGTKKRIDMTHYNG